jgi:hypothetical protein
MNDQEHKCKCDFRIRMLGDGCRYCQPQEYIDRLHDTLDGMIHTDCFELTYEEINIVGIKTLGSIWNCYDEELVDFARAILRKAQEK